MKHLIKLSVFLLIIGVGYAFISSSNDNTTKETSIVESLTWHTSLDSVHILSQQSNKPIFAFFTGSDWCGWCHKLQREVFQKEAFIKWANEKVILLELDFPRKKQLDSTLQKQNFQLQRGLGVRGYPTVWILKTNMVDSTNNLNINPIGSLGYPSGAEAGKEEVLFISNANQILAKIK